MKLIVGLKFYIIICLIFISSAIIGTFTFGKIHFHSIINKYNSPFQDIFFKYFTNVGDGLFAVIILLIILFIVNIRTFFIGLSTFLISGIISQIMKKMIFADELRPSMYFRTEQLHYVKGVVLHSNNSFPSGHATTAFAIFLFLSYIYKNKYYQIIFAIIACLTAYSRVYLSQHFFCDIAAGGIVGLLSFFIAYLIFNTIKINWFDKTLKSFFISNY